MVTAQQVYEQALVLMDEVTDSGEVVSDNPDYYQAKALSVLTTLQTELLPLSVDPVVLSDMNQELLVPDRTALLVLPYGLAAHLLLTEDSMAATFFNNRYEELKIKRPSKIEKITNVYPGGSEY